MKCHASPLHEVREEAHTICVRVCAHQSKWPSSWPALGADHRLISSWIQCTESHENPACCSTGTCQCMHLPSKPAFWPSTDVFSCLNSVHTEVLCTNALPAAAQDPASAYVLSLKSPLSGPESKPLLEGPVWSDLNLIEILVWMMDIISLGACRCQVTLLASSNHRASPACCTGHAPQLLGGGWRKWCGEGQAGPSDFHLPLAATWAQNNWVLVSGPQRESCALLDLYAFRCFNQVLSVASNLAVQDLPISTGSELSNAASVPFFHTHPSHIRQLATSAGSHPHTSQQHGLGLEFRAKTAATLLLAAPGITRLATQRMHAHILKGVPSVNPRSAVFSRQPCAPVPPSCKPSRLHQPLRASSTRVEIPGLKPEPWLGSPQQLAVGAFLCFRSSAAVSGVEQVNLRNKCGDLPCNSVKILVL
eukprot:456963-Pelagomonas_calceolata.AAC.1